MIRIRNLTKRYGEKAAVDGLSFDVPAGVVTGFLGPNGAGKSTTMRMVLDLVAPTSGEALVNGRRYREIETPAHVVGAALDAQSFHPGRTPRNHLRGLAASNGIPERRVDSVLELAGLTDVADQRAGGFSLGMGQRLALAAALIGDPGVLVLDEPVTGLDPDGVRWIRNLLRQLASEGRTVFVSSHLLSEMALTADRLVVVGRGRLIADTTVEEFVRQGSNQDVLVRTPAARALTEAIAALGATVRDESDGAIAVSGIDAAAVGEVALARGIVLHELTPRWASLEDAFMEVTAGSIEYHATTGGR